MTLYGESKTKLEASFTTQGIKLLQKRTSIIRVKNGITTTSSSSQNVMITEGDFLQLLTTYSSSNAVAFSVVQCMEPLLFDPVQCLCNWPWEVEVEEGAEYPDYGIMVIYDDGWVEWFPWLFNFDPLSITPDPEIPEVPIGGGGSGGGGGGSGGGGSWGGGGSGAEGDNPNIIPSVSVAQVAPSSGNKIAFDLSFDTWGQYAREYVDLEIGASLSNGIWTAVLLSVKGSYSVQTKLIPGVQEVGGTNASNYCAQVRDLKALSYNDQGEWYMISAIEAHENVHVSRAYPALQTALPSIKADVATLTVPNTGQSKAQAILQLQALAAFQNVKNNALVSWRDISITYIDADHVFPSGPAYVAERNVVAPVGTSICNTASTQAWPTCTFCPF